MKVGWTVTAVSLRKIFSNFAHDYKVMREDDMCEACSTHGRDEK
jgi:hypothetical protein